MKTFILTTTLLMMSGVALGQERKNEVSLSGGGYFTQPTIGYFKPSMHPTGQTDKSSAAGTIEYRRWLSPVTSLGLSYSYNPTDSKLFNLNGGALDIWPLRRHEFDILATRHLGTSGRLSTNLRYGFAATILDGGNTQTGGSGLDHQLGALGGVETDLAVSSRWSLRASLTADFAKASTYTDHTYRSSESVIARPEIGAVYRF